MWSASWRPWNSGQPGAKLGWTVCQRAHPAGGGVGAVGARPDSDHAPMAVVSARLCCDQVESSRVIMRVKGDSIYARWRTG